MTARKRKRVSLVELIKDVTSPPGINTREEYWLSINKLVLQTNTILHRILEMGGLGIDGKDILETIRVTFLRVCSLEGDISIESLRAPKAAPTLAATEKGKGVIYSIVHIKNMLATFPVIVALEEFKELDRMITATGGEILLSYTAAVLVESQAFEGSKGTR